MKVFRHKPAETIFPVALENNVGIIIRVPLASGMLTGLYSKETSFKRTDHRLFNRQGAMFDKGETFSGVDFETGLKAVEALKQAFPGRENMAPLALKWILMFREISCVIPGASSEKQLLYNLGSMDEPQLTGEQVEMVS